MFFHGMASHGLQGPPDVAVSSLKDLKDQLAYESSGPYPDAQASPTQPGPSMSFAVAHQALQPQGQGLGLGLGLFGVGGSDQAKASTVNFGSSSSFGANGMGLWSPVSSKRTRTCMSQFRHLLRNQHDLEDVARECTEDGDGMEGEEREDGVEGVSDAEDVDMGMDPCNEPMHPTSFRQFLDH